MGIVLDTNVIIQGERGVFDLPAWMDKHADEAFAVAAITVAELWHGIERASAHHRALRERYITDTLDVLPILPYTEVTAVEHARIWARLESSGKMIGFYDLIVAATALEHGSTIATFNKRHFEGIAGLRLTEPEL